jgi:hypothetical protein
MLPSLPYSRVRCSGARAHNADETAGRKIARGEKEEGDESRRRRRIGRTKFVVMSVIDILTRVDVLCKKYEKYDLDKQWAGADSMSGNDQFLRLYTVVEADIEAAREVRCLSPLACVYGRNLAPLTFSLERRGIAAVLQICCIW